MENVGVFQPISNGLLTGINQDSVVLLDCLTTLVDNELFTQNHFHPMSRLNQSFYEHIFTKIIDAIEAIRKQVCLSHYRQQ